MFLLRGPWFNSPTAVVVASTLDEAIKLVSQEDRLCPWLSTTVVVVGEWELAEGHNKAAFQFFIANDRQTYVRRKTIKEFREELETSVEEVREALTAGPATFDEVAERIGQDTPGPVGFSLGTLGARNEIGYSEGARFALKEESVGEARKPFAYQAVLDSLRRYPGTFEEISERTGITQPSEIGFALGWIYGEGKIVFRGSPGRERWHCR